MRHRRYVLIVGVGCVALNAIAAYALFSVPSREGSGETQEPIARALPADHNASLGVQETLSTVREGVVEQREVTGEHGAGSAATRSSSTLVSDVHAPEASPGRVVVPIMEAGSVLHNMELLAFASSTFTFSGRAYPGLGMFIEEVSGTRAEQGLYWILYVNGTHAPRGVSSMQVTTADTVEWRLEKNIYR